MTDHSLTSVTRRRLLQGAAAWAGAAALPASFAADAPSLRIGFQKGGGLLTVVKAQGHLEQTFTAQGWSVTWHEFPAGPQLLEALNAGSVDFGYTGAPPPIFAQAADKDIVYVGAEPSGPTIEAVVVKPNSPVKTVTDLRGKRVAVQKGSSANFLLVAALEKAGIGFDEIQPIYLAPADARAAFESDRVDAWTIWDPYLAAAQASLQVRSLADYTNLLHTNSFYESSRAFAAKSPKQLDIVLDELAKTGAWASAHPADVARLIAPQIGLPTEVVEVWQRRTRYGVQPVDGTVIATQQKVADTFFEHKLIPKKIDVGTAVWRWQRS